jgi:hypothetical protein
MSAIDHEYGTPLLFPRVEFHVNRLKAIIMGGGAIGLGILFAFPPAAHRSLQGSTTDVFAAIVALTGAAALIAIGLYILMRMLLWRGPAVVIDGHGIHDRRAGPVMTPWTRVHDVRVLDRHGHHIGIDTLDSLSETVFPVRRRLSRILSQVGLRHAEPVTVIDTFFLRSITGNRVLDFVMPVTALTPIDLSETPVSAKTLAADAAYARNRALSLLCFTAIAGIAPAVAAIAIAV